MIVHSTFHTLITALEEARDEMWKTDADGPDRPAYIAAYGAYQARRKELFEWVQQNTPRPHSAYQLNLHF